MPNIKISALPEVTTVSGSDITAVVATGVTSKISIDNLSLKLSPIGSTGSTIFSTNPLAGPNLPTENSIVLGDAAGGESPNSSNVNYIGYQAGQYSDDSYSSNFIGIGAGYGSVNSNYINAIGHNAGQSFGEHDESNFIGYNAGKNSSYIDFSNFVGSRAGEGSDYTTYSNFIGTEIRADFVSHSNFIGTQAGRDANGANFSNFIGYQTGFGQTGSLYSTYIGYQVAELFAPFYLGANNIIIGTNITLPQARRDSINLGAIIFATGSYSTTTGNPYSGSVDGRVGINVVNPRYTLDVSGSGNYTNGLTVTGSIVVSGSLNATASWAQNAVSSSYPFALSGSTIYTTAFGSTTLFSTQESTFIGQQAGASSSYAGNNNRWITAVGYQAASASDDAESSVSVGHLAGSKSYIYETVSIGKDAGYTSSFLQGGVNIGARAGSESNMGYTVAIGNGAGQRVRINPSLFGVYYSVFIGHNAGYSTTQPGYGTTFIGRGAGQFSSHITDTVAIGTFVAESAVSSSENSFIGSGAGQYSNRVYNTVVLGRYAGDTLTNVSESVFIGERVGQGASNTKESTFIGSYSGYFANSSSFTNAIGHYAGFQISGSNHSILIGSGVGRRISGAGIGENNIIIGKNITLENGRRNSMNLGGIIFATGSYAADSVNYFVNPAFSGSAGGRVGINVINPTYTLDVSGSGNYTNGLTVTGSLATLGDITASNALFTGTVTAQRLVVQIITSSVSFITGSTKFGSLLTDTHQFTGSVGITGSLTLTGSFGVLGPSIITNNVENRLQLSSFYSSSRATAYVLSISGSVTARTANNSDEVIGLDLSPALNNGNNFAHTQILHGIKINPIFGGGGGSATEPYRAISIEKGNLFINPTSFTNRPVYIKGTVEARNHASSIDIETAVSWLSNTTTSRTIDIRPSVASGVYFSTAGYIGINWNPTITGEFLSTGGVIGIRLQGSPSGSTNYTGVEVTPTYGTVTGATIVGFRYNPTITSLSSGFNYAFISSTGSHGFGTLTPQYTVDVSGSARITNGLIVTGSSTINNLTGSLFGTSSWALNVPASGVSGLNLNSISTGSVTASVNINTASFQITSASSQLLFVSNSGLITAQRLFLSSSRNMASGSTLVVFGSGSAQPVFTVQGSQGELFSVNDSLSGSLFSVNDISGLPIIEAFSDNRVFIGSYQAPMLTTTVRTTLAVGNNMIYQNVPTASYDAVFFEYSLKSGSNARAGSIMGIWSGSDANYNEVVTADYGDTTGVKFMVMVTGSNIALTGSATTANWTMKTIIRSI